MQRDSFATLVNEVVREGQSFARAEIALLKVEAREHATRGVACLLVALASSVSLVTALALAAAAWVIAVQGGAVAALLTAAGVHVTVSAIAITVTVLKLRSAGTTRAAAPPTELGYSRREAS
jgi:Putative Actinobacterial Holin-X, holin superfamily III